MQTFSNVDLNACTPDEIYESIIKRFGTDMLKIRQVADTLGVSVFTIRLWNIKGVLKCIQYRHGGACRWPAKEVANFIHSSINNQ